MELQLARSRAGSARIARLGTVRPDGSPHLVPCCFVLDGDTAYSAVDSKPKSTTRLSRIRNIERHPAASLLVDHYDEDWSTLWWIRMDGPARVVQSSSEADRARDQLRKKYPQYSAGVVVDGTVIALEISRWVSWP